MRFFRGSRSWLTSRGLAMAMTLWVAAPYPVAAMAEWVVWKDFSIFRRQTNSVEGSWTLVSPVVTNAIPWEELVVSWNIPGPAWIRIEARGFHEGIPTRWYEMGDWTLAHSRPRTSFGPQKDADGHVATDTLVMSRPADAFEVRITSRVNDPPLKLLAVSTAQARPRIEALSQLSPAILSVPEKSQADYPQGVQTWCSPTTSAMLLAYWAEKRGRPDWQASVPLTATAVDDPGWPGTGNWPFNTAFIGSHPGLFSCVVRANRPSDLVAWIGAGYPVGVSVSLAILNGESNPTPGDGHLIVVCGGDGHGGVVINDPGRALPRVRRTIPSENFVRAWAYSAYTAYLVWPEDQPIPSGARVSQAMGVSQGWESTDGSR